MSRIGAAVVVCVWLPCVASAVFFALRVYHADIFVLLIKEQRGLHA
ncbi:MAG: hypothetical protein ACRDSJ_04550 [Rubrobacteraceae bacterium]